MKKYELTEETKEFYGRILHRIKALKDFGDVKKGDLGGWIENESNLSQSELCWVYEEARVFGDAIVSGDAIVCEKARVYGRARVCGETIVYGEAGVYGRARVYGKARVSGDAIVRDNARVFGEADVSGRARVCGEAEINECQVILKGSINFPLNSIENSLKAQLGLCFNKNKVILYKRVNKISKGKYVSLYDNNFIYNDDKISKAKNPNMTNASCTAGLHCSLATYWSDGDTLIAVEVKKEDIITIQEGKVRCKKLKVLGEI